MPQPKYIPFDPFPRSLRAEVERLLAARQNAGLFGDDMSTRPIGPTSAESIRRRIHRAADALVRAGEPIKTIKSIKMLTSPESYRKILQTCNNDRGRRPNFDNWYLASFLRSLGKKWIRQSPEDQSELRKWHKRLPDPRRSMGRTYADLLQQFDDPDALLRLAQAPADIWDQLFSENRLTGHTLARAHRALGLDLMITAAPRLDALVSFSFEKHFKLDCPNGCGALFLDGSQTPSHQPLKCDLPPDVVQRLVEYRDILYPAIADTPATHLFARRDGRLKTKSQVRTLIQEAAWRIARVRVTPQMFRALAGMLMIKDGKSLEEVATALGCKSIQGLRAQFEDILGDRDVEEYARSLQTPKHLCKTTLE